MEYQQNIRNQKNLFIEQKQNDMRHSGNREDVIGAKTGKSKQISKEWQQRRALTGMLY